MTEQCHALSLDVSFNPIENTTANDIVLTPSLKVSEPVMALNPVYLLEDEKYHVTAQLHNDTGELIASGFTNISTFDVQNVTLPVEVKLNAVCPNISFANGSVANAFVVLTRIDEAGVDEAFNKTFQQNRSTRQAYDCVEVHRNGGIYKLSIYDIQNGTRSQKPALVLPEQIEVAPLTATGEGMFCEC